MAVPYAPCVECGGQARKVTGKVIYPHRPDLHKRIFYKCQCGAYVGSHKGSGRPLGFAAGTGTRKARARAHRLFDPLWKERHMSRRHAYNWLAQCLGINPLACHIAMMDRETALRVARVAAPKLEELRREAREAAATQDPAPGQDAVADENTAAANVRFAREAAQTLNAPEAP